MPPIFARVYGVRGLVCGASAHADAAQRFGRTGRRSVHALRMSHAAPEGALSAFLDRYADAATAPICGVCGDEIDFAKVSES